MKMENRNCPTIVKFFCDNLKHDFLPDQFDPDLGEVEDDSPEVFSVLSVTFSEWSFEPMPSSIDIA